MGEIPFMEFDASFVRVRIVDADGEVNAAAAQDDVAQDIIWIPEIMGFRVRRAVKLRLSRRTSHKVSAAFVLLGRYSFPILCAVPRNFSFPPMVVGVRAWDIIMTDETAILR